MAEVNFSERDGIAIIEINRPEARNAVNRAVAEGIAQAVQTLDRRDDLRVGILTGAGGTFCSGMDLKAFLRGEKVTIEGRGFAGLVQAPPKKPLIAAAEGYVLAGGFELALTCDLIVASREAKFGLPEVKRGLVANAGGMIRLPRQIPQRIAMELVLTGDMISAERAERYGLVNRVVEPGTALEEALKLARAIVENGPMAVAVSKRVVLESQDWSTTEMFQRQQEITAPIFTSEDAREGATAFAEKRKPVWKGR
ncbi:crotonase/enoyl-CoA hydratase family protein [Rhodoligotrophos defluvii]|uniref:crotonase/enoyl-CoA hydratase family protein n=1 Tax=Rhodoligotrophos defluvii TaxID=2561934 RepID=UPI0010C9B9AE|nr:crotonase/enoyl-CoA hydratase family protein [Rhodoligotrophos defluvii]